MSAPGREQPCYSRTGSRASVVVLVLMALSAIAPTVSAQEDRYAPIVLQLPASSRATGLGGAATAVRDVEAIFANPALLGTVAGTAVGFGRFGSAATLATLASSTSLGAFSVGLGAQILDFGVFSGRAPLSSRVLTDRGVGAGSSAAGALGLATVFKGLRWGAALKVVSEHLAGVRDASPALDLGVAREGGQIVFGLTAQNIGPAIELGGAGVSLPMRFSLGMAGFGLPVGPLDFGASLATSVLRNGFVAAAAATEWGYSPLEGYSFAGRFGLRRPELREQGILTAGATITVDRFAFDYAFEDLRHGLAHRLALRVR